MKDPLRQRTNVDGSSDTDISLFEECLSRFTEKKVDKSVEDLSSFRARLGGKENRVEDLSRFLLVVLVIKKWTTVLVISKVGKIVQERLSRRTDKIKVDKSVHHLASSRARLGGKENSASLAFVLDCT